MKKTLILQCPGMVCSPPVVSKCLGEAHRRLDIIYIIYITLHYITLILFFSFHHTVGNLEIVTRRGAALARFGGIPGGWVPDYEEDLPKQSWRLLSKKRLAT